MPPVDNYSPGPPYRPVPDYGDKPCDKPETPKASADGYVPKTEYGESATKAFVDSCGPCRLNARSLISMRIAECHRRAEALQTLYESLPATLTPPLEEAVYEIVSAMRRPV